MTYAKSLVLIAAKLQSLSLADAAVELHDHLNRCKSQFYTKGYNDAKEGKESKVRVAESLLRSGNTHPNKGLALVETGNKDNILPNE